MVTLSDALGDYRRLLSSGTPFKIHRFLPADVGILSINACNLPPPFPTHITNLSVTCIDDGSEANISSHVDQPNGNILDVDLFLPT